MLVTGGLGLNSVEVLSSEGTSLCTLPPLPFGRWGHTQDGPISCGGEWSSSLYYSTTTCVKLSALDGRWVVSHNLRESRRYHCSWESPVGLVLMGGWYDKYNNGSGNNGFTTTELLSSSGSSSSDSFTLQYETS